jgi:hypothetical protein
MRDAPPAQAWCSSDGPWLRVQQLIHSSSAAVAGFWVGAHLGLGVAAWLLLGLSLAPAAAWLAARSLRAAPAQLIWDGSTWSLRCAGAEPQRGRALPMLDLGGWLLVRFDPAEPAAPRGNRWLALARRDAPAGWPALRVALHAA